MWSAQGTARVRSGKEKKGKRLLFPVGRLDLCHLGGWRLVPMSWVTLSSSLSLPLFVSVHSGRSQQSFVLSHSFFSHSQLCLPYLTTSLLTTPSSCQCLHQSHTHQLPPSSADDNFNHFFVSHSPHTIDHMHKSRTSHCTDVSYKLKWGAWLCLQMLFANVLSTISHLILFFIATCCFRKVSVRLQLLIWCLSAPISL